MIEQDDEDIESPISFGRLRLQRKLGVLLGQ